MTPEPGRETHPVQPAIACATGSAAASSPGEPVWAAGRGPRRHRLPRLLVVIAVLGPLGLAPWIYGRWIALGAPPAPAIDMGGVDSLVAEAINDARAAVEKDRVSARAWGLLGQVLRAHEFYQEGDLCFDRAAELDPRDPRWPYLIARGPRCTDPDVALPYLLRAVQHCRDADVPRLALGELLQDQGRVEEAQGQFVAVLVSDPGNARARFGLGRIAFGRGDLKQALDHLRRSSAAAPDVKAIHIFLAEAYGRSGDHRAAEEELLRIAGMPDGSMWPDPYLSEVASRRVGLKARLTLVQNLQARGRDAEALQHLVAAARDYPQDYKPYLSLGQALNRLGRCAEAEQPLRTAMRLRKDHGIIYLELACSLQNQSQDEEASDCYRTAIRLQPNLAQAHFNLSLILAARADLDGAQKELLESLRLEPDFVEGHVQLGKLLARQGQLARALKEIERAAKLAPDDETIAAILKQLRANPVHSNATPPAPPS